MGRFLNRRETLWIYGACYLPAALMVERAVGLVYYWTVYRFTPFGLGQQILGVTEKILVAFLVLTAGFSVLKALTRLPPWHIFSKEAWGAAVLNVAVGAAIAQTVSAVFVVWFALRPATSPWLQGVCYALQGLAYTAVAVNVCRRYLFAGDRYHQALGRLSRRWGGLALWGLLVAGVLYSTAVFAANWRLENAMEVGFALVADLESRVVSMPVWAAAAVSIAAAVDLGRQLGGR